MRSANSPVSHAIVEEDHVAFPEVSDDLCNFVSACERLVELGDQGLTLPQEKQRMGMIILSVFACV